ncbi:glycosyltransferase family 2 protein [Pusillimonas sp. SM2304]|uniref:glycosyltransferase family 2 protein n=1 Tax=Pusillimonas sp. SM2304 TaxID=3073241 RepID=UPI002874FE69|nr:glycosyltransferase family 2 protein [Pusillimonas sp. SM2304]MDS1140871.1 glycosyltransferase family 2 protein [Pusillimonas sp. SM2304]
MSHSRRFTHSSSGASQCMGANTGIPRPLMQGAHEARSLPAETHAFAAPVQSDHPKHSNEERLELSVVLPLHNEAEVIHLMYRRLKAAIAPLNVRYELVFVDDGSNDGTTAALSGIALRDPQVAVIVFTRHFGKEAALDAGLALAGGQAIIIMDADLQDPPEHIPGMLAAWRKGANAVLMRRRNPYPGPMLRHLGKWCLHRMLDVIGDVGMPKDKVDFMLYDQKALDALSLVVHRKRYMHTIFEWAGIKQAVIEYNRQPRAAGSSKSSILTFLGLAADDTSIYTDVLLRALMSLGLVGALASLLYAGCIFTAAAVLHDPAPAKPLALSTQALLWSALLFLAGWMGKSINRTRPCTKRPRYVVKKLMRSRVPSVL